MKFREGIKLVKEINNDFGGEIGLYIAAQDELTKYNEDFNNYGYVGAQKKLTQTSRFILGLVYSEFLAEEDTNEGQFLAAEKARIFREKLGIDSDKLFRARYELNGF